MERETITREEFDQRLEQSTERMRQKSLLLESRATELEELINRYASVLERLKATNELKDQTSCSYRRLK
jgi:BMFP domain-containing protein YqiC